MTFAQLKSAVSYILDDLNFGYFTETQVGLWLNNAQKRVQKRLIKAGQNDYVRCLQTTLVVNQNDYVLPEDFKDVNRLEVVISGVSPNESVCQLTPITVNQQNFVLTGAGTPRWYFLKKNRLVVLPAPDTALTMRLLETYEVTDMTLDADTPDVPESYQEYMTLLAAEQGFIKDGRENALLVKKIKEIEAEIDSDAAERTVDAPRSVVETGNSLDSGFLW